VRERRTGRATAGWRGIVVHPDGRAVSHPWAVSGALRVLKPLGVNGVELPMVWAVAQPGSTAPSQIHRQFNALITKLLDEYATTAEERACQGRQVPIARRPASGCGSSPWSTIRCSSLSATLDEENPQGGASRAVPARVEEERDYGGKRL
jgi:hypothetical protein